MPRDHNIHTVIGFELGAELGIEVHFDLQTPTIRYQQRCSLAVAEQTVLTRKYIYLATLYRVKSTK